MEVGRGDYVAKRYTWQQEEWWKGDVACSFGKHVRSIALQNCNCKVFRLLYNNFLKNIKEYCGNVFLIVVLRKF